MTSVVNVTGDEALKLAPEGNALILGEVGVHVHFLC